jgi:hypothetical protein
LIMALTGYYPRHFEGFIIIQAKKNDKPAA